MGSGKLQGEDGVGFHRPTYLKRGRLNVGAGVLEYQGRRYTFGVRGLGAEGIETANIEASGQVYGLARLRDFSGTFFRAGQSTLTGSWLQNKKGVIIRLAERNAVPLFPVRGSVIIKLK